MRRLEHALIGAGCGAAVAHVAGLDMGVSMAIAAVGASVPDVDLKWSDRWNRPRPGSACRLLDHRGPLHSLLAGTALGCALTLVMPWWIGLCFSVGFISHLIADGGSYMGVPFFWPLYSRRIRLLPDSLRVRSGTTIIELPVAVVILVVGLYIAGLV